MNPMALKMALMKRRQGLVNSDDYASNESGMDEGLPDKDTDLAPETYDESDKIENMGDDTIDQSLEEEAAESPQEAQAEKEKTEEELLAELMKDMDKRGNTIDGKASMLMANRMNKIKGKVA